MLALEGEVHLPGDAAVAEVAGGTGAEFADVLRFGEVHFEEAADARGQRQEVERRERGFRRGAASDGGAGCVGGVDGALIVGEDAGFFESCGVAGVGRFVAVERRESLLDLHAAAVAVHVAESADVHEDVEAECRSGVEGAKSFVVAAAVAQANLDDFGDAGGGKRCDEVADLSIGVVASPVDECGGQFNFKSLGAFDEVDDGSRGGRACL